MLHKDLLHDRGGRIDPIRRQEGTFDAESRIDQAIAESFPASDPPSWSSGIDELPSEDDPAKEKKPPK